jgi:hypothetical protein
VRGGTDYHPSFLGFWFVLANSFFAIDKSELFTIAILNESREGKAYNKQLKYTYLFYCAVRKLEFDIAICGVQNTPQMAKNGKNRLAILPIFRFRRTHVKKGIKQAFHCHILSLSIET